MQKIVAKRLKEKRRKRGKGETVCVKPLFLLFSFDPLAKKGRPSRGSHGIHIYPLD
jgi:hypothetical protein